MSKINVNTLDRYLKKAESLPKKEKMKSKKKSSIYNKPEDDL